MPLANDTLFLKPSLTDQKDWKTSRKCVIINAFWPHLQLAEQDYIEEDYTAFFDFLGRTLQNLSPHASKFAAQEWEGLFSIVTSLNTNRAMPRKEITEDIKKGFLNIGEPAISRSVELALRLWLGVNVCSKGSSVGPRNPRDGRTDWRDDQSLDEMIMGLFQPDPIEAISPSIGFDESFTVVNIKNICRLRVRWTDNLSDHLRLEGPRGQRCLSIYRHKLGLVNHMKGPKPHIIPTEVLDEAIRTLDLLFPFGDPKTEAFLDEEMIRFWMIAPLESPRSAKLGEFKYWRSNLVQLLKLYNGPPETVIQTLLDTRNISQFATLWVAIFGVFFLTIMFGVISTVYSIKQYQISLKAYELALAQACQQIDRPLPAFCN